MDQKIILEGYMLKLGGSGYYLGVGPNSSLPMIFLTREEAEKVEVEMHSEPVNAALDTKIIKVQLKEKEDENLYRSGQWINGNLVRDQRGKMSVFHTDSSEEGTELHEEERYNF